MAEKRLYRSLSDKMISGVCGGIGEYFNIDPTVIRIAWVAIAILSLPAGLIIGGLAYLACWLIIPQNPEEVALVETQGLEDQEPEPQEERDIQSNSMIWGIVLILLAAAILARTHILPFHWRGGGMVLPLVLIGLGVYLLYKYRPDIVEQFKRFWGERRLYRSHTDKKIFGVCGGLADSFHVDPTLVRLAWILGTFLTGGFGVLLYLILAFVLPSGRPNSIQTS